MSNEPAERLLARITKLYENVESPDSQDLYNAEENMKAALAAERRATVERIRNEVGLEAGWEKHGADINPFDLDAILDAEAQR